MSLQETEVLADQQRFLAAHRAYLNKKAEHEESIFNYKTFIAAE